MAKKKSTKANSNSNPTTEPSLYNKIDKLLEKRFVYHSDFARIISLALEGGKNVIVSGPGGHGKSQMTMEIIRGLGLEEKTFVQFFGEGMDESRIYGGINFAKLESDNVLEYQPDRSFLDSEIVIFEELFDAPASVLLALKDTLTAGAMRNGAQVHPMKTKTIICLTNKSPKEISDLGPSAHALIERFPLQLEQKWPHYTEVDYTRLLKKVGCSIADPKDVIDILAGVCRKCTEDGNFVSPRTAVESMNVCATAAKMRGSKVIEPDDLTDLKFIPGMDGQTKAIIEKIERDRKIREQEKIVKDFETRLKSLTKIANSTKDSTECLKVCKAAKELVEETHKVAIHDDLVPKREKVREQAFELVQAAQEKAVKLCG